MNRDPTSYFIAALIFITIIQIGAWNSMVDLRHDCRKLNTSQHLVMHEIDVNLKKTFEEIMFALHFPPLHHEICKQAIVKPISSFSWKFSNNISASTTESLGLPQKNTPLCKLNLRPSEPHINSSLRVYVTRKSKNDVAINEEQKLIKLFYGDQLRVEMVTNLWSPDDDDKIVCVLNAKCLRTSSNDNTFLGARGKDAAQIIDTNEKWSESEFWNNQRPHGDHQTQFVPIPPESRRYNLSSYWQQQLAHNWNEQRKTWVGSPNSTESGKSSTPSVGRSTSRFEDIRTLFPSSPSHNSAPLTKGSPFAIYSNTILKKTTFKRPDPLTSASSNDEEMSSTRKSTEKRTGHFTTSTYSTKSVSRELTISKWDTPTTNTVNAHASFKSTAVALTLSSSNKFSSSPNPDFEGTIEKLNPKTATPFQLPTSTQTLFTTSLVKDLNAIDASKAIRTLHPLSTTLKMRPENTYTYRIIPTNQVTTSIPLGTKSTKNLNKETTRLSASSKPSSSSPKLKSTHFLNSSSELSTPSTTYWLTGLTGENKTQNDSIYNSNWKTSYSTPSTAKMTSAFTDSFRKKSTVGITNSEGFNGFSNFFSTEKPTSRLNKKKFETTFTTKSLLTEAEGSRTNSDDITGVIPNMNETSVFKFETTWLQHNITTTKETSNAILSTLGTNTIETITTSKALSETSNVIEASSDPSNLVCKTNSGEICVQGEWQFEEAGGVTTWFINCIPMTGDGKNVYHDLSDDSNKEDVIFMCPVSLGKDKTVHASLQNYQKHFKTCLTDIKECLTERNIVEQFSPVQEGCLTINNENCISTVWRDSKGHWFLTCRQEGRGFRKNILLEWILSTERNFHSNRVLCSFLNSI